MRHWPRHWWRWCATPSCGRKWANRRKAARDFGQAAMVRAWGALLDGALGA
jgi:hypothetical protein